MSRRHLSHAQARRVYDRIGGLLDTQAVYEDAAIDALVRASSFESARSVLELGCGTGRFAERLLADHLPDDARYLGVDVSPRMVSLSRRRLARFGPRAEVQRTDGSIGVGAPAAAFDRVVSTYVCDLLSETDVEALVAEAGRLLRDGGRLCLVSATHGTRRRERALMGLFDRVCAVSPGLVGGCRPIELMDHVREDRFRILHREVVSRFWICSEILVAEPRR